MNAAHGAGADHEVVHRLGFAKDQVVQEFGYDDDVDGDFRDAVEGRCAGELEDEDYTGECDAVLLWWRDGDGDLGDTLVDVSGTLDDDGFVALLTPRPGADGEVEASAVEEAVTAAGLHISGSFTVGGDWRATRLAAPRRGKR